MILTSTTLCLLLALAILMLTPAALQAGRALSDNIPLTRHALDGHAHQTWNAASIMDFMKSGGCIPKEYSCAAQDFTVRYCEIKPGLSIGLIIGNTIRQVVTGFAARTTYWQNRCR